MTGIMKPLAVASLALGLSGLAQAAPVITLENTAVTSVANATSITFEDGCAPAGYVSCTGDYSLYSDSIGGQSARPVGSTGNFLSVPNPQTSGSALFALDGDYNYFGLLWGSFDTYNSIAFFNDGIEIASFAGDEIYDPADGNQNLSWFVNFFFGSEFFDAIELTSTQLALETDNHAYANVPEPGTLALFGLGLVGFGLARRKDRA